MSEFPATIETWFDSFGDTNNIATRHEDHKTPLPCNEMEISKWKEGATFDLEPVMKFYDIPETKRAMKETAIESQIDGDHYMKQGVQPLEATFLNFGYDGLRASIYTKVGKYLTREKGTHRKDITKAIHCLEMQLEFFDRDSAKKDTNK